MYDMDSLAILRITGKDASSFLQGYVTNDLNLIEPQIGLPTALTNIKGRVIANGWFFGDANTVSLVVHASVEEITRSHLQKYIVFSQAFIEKRTLFRGLVDENRSGEVQLQPFGWSLTQSEFAAADIARLTVAAEYPLICSATTEKFLPQMLNLTEHGTVSFTKGCYLGQEVVARAEHRGNVKRTLRSLSIQGELPTLGSAIDLDDGRTGTVVAVDRSNILAVG